MSKNMLMTASELVLRLERPSCVHTRDGMFYLSPNGPSIERRKSMLLYRDEITEIFEKICKSSVYSFEDQIKNGFITIEGGHRVGICGTAVIKDDKISGFRDISGFVFRITHEIEGAALGLMKYVLKHGKVFNTAIISPPGGGKTTVLRDLCRILSGGGFRVAVVDERGEIAGVSEGVPSFKSCELCEILDRCPKADGIERAVRTLCPDVIVFDELGDVCQAEQLVSAMNSGVSFIFSVHSDSFARASRRQAFGLLLDSGAVDVAIVLKDDWKKTGAVDIADSLGGGENHKTDSVDIDPCGKLVLGNI